MFYYSYELTRTQCKQKVHGEIMDDIKDVQLVECEKSNYIKPIRVLFTQNGRKRAWDAMKVHDSVAILIYNSSRNVFILVKQFRPAVYINAAKSMQDETGNVTIDHTKYPGSLGLTYELCAGIVDKEKSVAEIAQEEILEECGYKVTTESLRRITGFRNGVGTSAAYQDMFYVEVTDEMKVSPGGGNQHEGELIDIVEIPLSEGRTFMMDESKPKHVGVMFAIMWFYENIQSKKV
ncbi:uridine diphosphate glucose pyrophosphatase NUDT14-like [Mercenaria mercenaria]|uniref:uridine diphosphate glucose pyrophosphatase NUDT14-like n=1 Tax=Mercenaria mercenaria TaxID=6596 RepID=UPI00234E7A74|nr:uridine diphosphate glucose pyrophosphatase NUDT14-like [Mercenaria mercenaria]